MREGFRLSEWSHFDLYNRRWCIVVYLFSKYHSFNKFVIRYDEDENLTGKFINIDEDYQEEYDFDDSDEMISALYDAEERCGRRV